jgi:hypothetical protein
LWAKTIASQRWRTDPSAAAFAIATASGQDDMGGRMDDERRVESAFNPIFCIFSLSSSTQIDTVMNRNFFAGLFVGLGLLAVFAFRPAGNEKPSDVQKWEYKVVHGKMGGIEKMPPIMNAFGIEGWELVDVKDVDGTQFYKRPIE